MLKFTTQEILLKNLDANMGQIPDVEQLTNSDLWSMVKEEGRWVEEALI